MERSIIPGGLESRPRGKKGKDFLKMEEKPNDLPGKGYHPLLKSGGNFTPCTTNIYHNGENQNNDIGGKHSPEKVPMI